MVHVMMDLRIIVYVELAMDFTISLGTVTIEQRNSKELARERRRQSSGVQRNGQAGHGAGRPMLQIRSTLTEALNKLERGAFGWQEGSIADNGESSRQPSMRKGLEL